jgi:coproporphyrinogen III oxidase
MAIKVHLLCAELKGFPSLTSTRLGGKMISSQIVVTADPIKPIGVAEPNSHRRDFHPDQRDIEAYFKELQNRICRELEMLDGEARFHEDSWNYSGGGGKTRILESGAVFEKAGVNFSAIRSALPPAIAAKLKIAPDPFFATGVSLVLHPVNPMVPIVHMNVRYFEQANEKRWFGGGADLTPCYPFLNDIRHFHATLKAACDAHDISYYPRFKKWCDEYFFIKHRNETRGVGGIFFDQLQGDVAADFAFVQSVGNAFLPAYLPIAYANRTMPYTAREKNFQLIRRSRYVEFNLVYDRGTAFGLETQGRIESILMSLPPVAQWPYGWVPEPGSAEAALSQFLAPRDWLGPDGIAKGGR